MMKELYRTSATSVGGREGRVRTDDGTLDLELATPSMMGGKGGATNPEQLFAAGWAACFNGALNLVARTRRVEVGQTQVKVEITLNRSDQGDFKLGSTITVTIPGVDQSTAEELVEAAHGVCPYSRATRGNIDAVLSAHGDAN